MRQTRLAYFDRFRCLAGACPDSCCAGWEIDVDDVSAARYRTLPGPLGDRLRQVLEETEDGVRFRCTDGRCPMWRQDGLCQIQAELGEAALCDVCREFPRLTHNYGAFRELGLELSCPEAARLILSDPGGPLLSRTVPDPVEEPEDPDALETLLRTREQAFTLLRQPGPIRQRLALLLLYGYQVQAELDGAEAAPFDPEDALRAGRALAEGADTPSFLPLFRSLEILTPQWRQRLDRPAAAADWDGPYEALARYGVLRYWLQAVSDYDLAARVKLVVLSCLLTAELGGDFLQTAQLYAKEIENDADNLDALLDAAYTHPALTDAALLHRLLF